LHAGKSTAAKYQLRQSADIAQCQAVAKIPSDEKNDPVIEVSSPEQS